MGYSMGLFTVDNTIKAGKLFTIYLDGVEQRYVIEADTDEGYVIRSKRNADGKPMRDGDGLVTERLTGNVTAVRLA